MKSQARLSVRSINQSNRSISVRLSFLFCSRAFISRSYENRSNRLQFVFQGRNPILLSSIQCGVRLIAVINNRNSGAPNDNFRKNICSEDDLRSRIFGTFVAKISCLPASPRIFEHLKMV